MGQQKYKRNHWVPQAYLRAFAADSNRAKIWTFGKTDGDPMLKPISKVAVKFYLYAPGENGQRDYSTEQKLGDLEQLFGNPFWSKVSTGFIDLNKPTIRKGVALLTAVMHLRNPKMLERTTDIYERFRELFMTEDEPPDIVEIAGRRLEVDKESWPAYRDAAPDDIKRMWLGSLNQAAWMAELLLKMRWAIIASDTPVFITSDNPVTIIHPSLQFRGLKDPETSVLFPLSPTRMLYLDNRRSEPDSQYYAVRGQGEAQNLLVWRNAIEHMLSHRHPDEVCAEMISGTHVA
ncbi:DUF4238 domain-containing protein [Aminobacter sp. NyZ550]|uniref:DUF4238 domain-containing protein n=1 Tax=Aminobacter sp. NyZ550 TaxID=2979870 RepID=UPI0021D57625|nr:DUF4238 domain-containing protein [Aminobacter sp. NyZ550]WAX94249.1 DUF4238 domain-containing protein [Aminobacter sp. NyZ550]